MDYYRLEYDLETHPSIKLLRLKHAPLIISFLHQQFKQTQRITIFQGELTEKLEDYLELLHETTPGLFPRPAQEYLDQWCNEHQFLRKYYIPESDEPVFELSPSAEKALGWLEELRHTDFVGTESRFRRIFDLLEEMATRGTEDVAARLAYLENQKAALEQEIETIRRTGVVERFSAQQIRERFFEANETFRRLLADFRQVEQNFREITRQVQQQQLQSDMRKGAVVEQVLEADEELRQSDQGRSFYAFWQFLTHAQRQEVLQSYLDIIYQLPEIEPLSDQHHSLRRLKRSLLVAGDKIIQSNQHLAEQLRRMLDEQYVAENRRVSELINGIKRLALTTVAEPPADRAFIELDDAPNLGLPLERPLWEPSSTPTFESRDLDLGAVDLSPADLSYLYSRAYVDETRLRRQIATLLLRQASVSLGRLTQDYPIQQGLPEVITYFMIAAGSDKHSIDEQTQEQVLLFNGSNGELAAGQVRQLTLPQIIFRR
ncbi:MAG TPA: DUF3375 domain-containing protein [Anaerolineae bacterium]|nr:DUF3375 domain-containing protein [Anaerolineae bacterium]HMR64621.1 DUF3375 domain-containing protein [Anaerolineae bacterium]